MKTCRWCHAGLAIVGGKDPHHIGPSGERIECRQDWDPEQGANVPQWALTALYGGFRWWSAFWRWFKGSR